MFTPEQLTCSLLVNVALVVGYIWASQVVLMKKNPPAKAGRYCKVRELEKVRFRERRRLTLYRNRSPLMRRQGAEVRQ